MPADKIELCGRGVTKTLKKLFNESDIPLSEREMVPLVADEKGVIWIKGFGISERVAVKGMAKKVVIFECL